MHKIIVQFIFLLFLFTSKSYAYLDPGSAGSLLSIILGAIVTAWGYILFQWKSFKSFLKKLFKKKKS